MSSHRLRLADLLAAAPSHESSTRGRCLSSDCLETTRENKAFCLEHLSRIPYVADLERRIAARHEQDDEVRKFGGKAVDVNSVTTLELLRHLDLYGPRTEERCVRELTLDDVTLQGYIEALRGKGFVDTGRTKRGSTVVLISESGREHLRCCSDMRDARTSVAPAENVSVDDARLSVSADGSSAKKKRTPTMSTGNGTGKSRRSKLQEAHAACEKAYSELAKAHAAGDREEVALVWNDVIVAEAAVAAVKAHVMADILAATPGEKADEKKASVKAPEKKAPEKKAPEKKAPETKAPAKEVAKKPVAKGATSKKSTVSASAFSNWLRVVRTGLGMTQSALGEKIGASYTQMFRWEKGLSVPAEEFLAKIERIAGKTCPYRQKAAV